jgi:hypothetical protein
MFHTHTRHFQSANIPDVHTNLKPHFLINIFCSKLIFFATNITAGFKRNKKQPCIWWGRRKDLVKNNTHRTGGRTLDHIQIYNPHAHSIHHLPLLPLIPSAEAPSSLRHIQGEPICVLWIHSQLSSSSWLRLYTKYLCCTYVNDHCFPKIMPLKYFKNFTSKCYIICKDLKPYMFSFPQVLFHIYKILPIGRYGFSPTQTRKLQRCMLYVFFWVIPRRLNFMCRRFGTLCLFHLPRQVG